MIRIEVVSTSVDEKRGNAKASGKPYLIREQAAYAVLTDREGKPKKYPTEIKLSLGDDQAPYPPGDYMLSPACIYADEYGRLAIGRPVLVKLQKQAAA